MNIPDILKRSYNIKIFSLNRIRYEELWEDCLAYVRKTYSDNAEKFSTASPFAQILSVCLHLFRMALYYIEDAITGLNIKTAWRPDQIRGLARLTGHDPGRSISSRAACRLIYTGQGSDEFEGGIVYIPNKITLTNTFNGLTYVVLFSADNARMTMQKGNYVNANIIQGNLRYQQATGTGYELQSFNIAERNYSTIDQYFINVYVNGEAWYKCSSINDMGYQQHACVVKTGQTGGLDVFFGNGNMGAIPPEGAAILVEYLITSGQNGNVEKEFLNQGDYWKFNNTGYLSDGTEVPLNGLFKVSMLTDIIFGSNYENILLTQQIAPNMSRSMVLANETNYKYFLRKMNMFSVIDIIQGFNTFEDTQAEQEYNLAYAEYTDAYKTYNYLMSHRVSSSDVDVTEHKKIVDEAAMKLRRAYQKKQNAKLDDSTIYLFLIPDIRNRITSSANYFTCDETTAFALTEDEKYNILNLIDMSGQGVITVENRILKPLYPRFSVNVQVRIWERFTYQDIYNRIIERLSDYFIDCTRRDRIPKSDLIALIEGIEGVDSVDIHFDADRNNRNIYGGTDENYYGIDEHGDVVLSRTVTAVSGDKIEIRDIYPLFRGGFISGMTGLEYSDIQAVDELSAVNVSLIGTTETDTGIRTQSIVNR